MKTIWINKAEELKNSVDKEFKETGSIDSKKMDKYMLLIEASERVWL